MVKTSYNLAIRMGTQQLYIYTKIIDVDAKTTKIDNKIKACINTRNFFSS